MALRRDLGFTTQSCVSGRAVGCGSWGGEASRQLPGRAGRGDVHGPGESARACRGMGGTGGLLSFSMSSP